MFTSVPWVLLAAKGLTWGRTNTVVQRALLTPHPTPQHSHTPRSRRTRMVQNWRCGWMEKLCEPPGRSSPGSRPQLLELILLKLDLKHCIPEPARSCQRELGPCGGFPFGGRFNQGENKTRNTHTLILVGPKTKHKLAGSWKTPIGLSPIPTVSSRLLPGYAFVQLAQGRHGTCEGGRLFGLIPMPTPPKSNVLNIGLGKHRLRIMQEPHTLRNAR